MSSKEGKEHGVESWERQLASCLDHPAAPGEVSTLVEGTAENRTMLGKSGEVESIGLGISDTTPAQRSSQGVASTGFSNKRFADMMEAVFGGRQTKLPYDTCPVCCSDNVLEGEMFCERCGNAYHTKLASSGNDTLDLRVLVRFVATGARLYERRAIVKGFIESITGKG